MIKKPETQGEDILRHAETTMIADVRRAELSLFILGLFQDENLARTFRESVHTRMICTDRLMNRQEIVINDCAPADPGHQIVNPLDYFNLRDEFD